MALSRRSTASRGTASAAVQQPVQVLEPVERVDDEFEAEAGEAIEAEAVLEVEATDHQADAEELVDPEPAPTDVADTPSASMAASSKASSFDNETVAVEPLQGIIGCNHEIVMLLEQLWSDPVAFGKLKRLVQGHLGEDAGGEWVAQMAEQFQLRRVHIQQLVNQAMTRR